MSSASTPPSQPVVITGMHRSGTSLVASYLASLGVGLGDRLLAADARNPHGYFEDADFRELQGEILTAATSEGDGGHRDWGWTEDERLDRGRLGVWSERARALAAARSGRPGLWGWKDPRTSLLLDFWDEILEHRALYVLLYRFPWAVADSMQRVGADVFLDHPEYAYRIWAFYNRHLLDFHHRHRDRSLLLSTDALLRDPARLALLLRDKLGLAVADGSFESLRDRDLFVSFAPDDPLVSLVAATSPQCTRLLAELDEQADLPATGLWRAAPLHRERPAGPVDLSVVIPCYDLGEVLVEAVASVERTAPDRCELIVVNDGSRQPRTLEVLAALRAGGYHVIDQPNSGLAAARNRGIGEARGRYVLPLDADNRLSPGFIASAIQVLDARPEVGVVYGDRLEFGARNSRRSIPELDLPTFLWANYIDACAAYRREIWESCGGYDAGALVWEDWDLWISAAERGWRFHRLPEVTFEYRVRPNSMLRNAEREGIRETVRAHIYRKHHALYAENLTAVLLTGHTYLHAVTVDALKLTAARDRLQREANAAAADAQAVRAARDRLQQEIDLLAASVDPERQAQALRALQRELDDCRWEMEFMKKTSAWRLRGVVLRLKQRLLR